MCSYDRSCAFFQQWLEQVKVETQKEWGAIAFISLWGVTLREQRGSWRNFGVSFGVEP